MNPLALVLLVTQSVFHLTWMGDGYVCVNDRGEFGLNAVPLARLVSSKEGECANLTNGNLKRLDLTDANLWYASLSKWGNGVMVSVHPL